MNFNNYPLKDELGEGLHLYERNTGRSAHLLVESLIEKYLIKKGILGSDEEELVDFPFELISDEESSPAVSQISSHPTFRKKANGKGMVQVWCDDLYFGYIKEENYLERVNELGQFSYDELKQISKNNWEKSNGSYSQFLRTKIRNPHLSVKECLNISRYSIGWRNNGSWQIRHDRFSICSGKGQESFNKIKNFLYHLSDEELEELKQELKDCKHRRKYILEKMESK